MLVSELMCISIVLAFAPERQGEAASRKHSMPKDKHLLKWLAGQVHQQGNLQLIHSAEPARCPCFVPSRPDFWKDCHSVPVGAWSPACKDGQSPALPRSKELQRAWRGTGTSAWAAQQQKSSAAVAQTQLSSSGLCCKAGLTQSFAPVQRWCRRCGILLYHHGHSKVSQKANPFLRSMINYWVFISLGY